MNSSSSTPPPFHLDTSKTASVVKHSPISLFESNNCIHALVNTSDIGLFTFPYGTEPKLSYLSVAHSIKLSVHTQCTQYLSETGNTNFEISSLATFGHEPSCLQWELVLAHTNLTSWPFDLFWAFHCFWAGDPDKYALCKSPTISTLRSFSLGQWLHYSQIRCLQPT